MYSVLSKNLLTGEEFTRTFDNFRDQRNYIIKCSYSKKIMVIGFECETEEEFERLKNKR